MEAVGVANRNPLTYTNPPQNPKSPFTKTQTLAASIHPPLPVTATTTMKSILQMILEREIYTETELQELLECFLQLNATCHHQVIVQAFMEICEEVFPKKNIVSGGGAPEQRRRNQITRKSR